MIILFSSVMAVFLHTFGYAPELSVAALIALFCFGFIPRAWVSLSFLKGYVTIQKVQAFDIAVGWLREVAFLAGCYILVMSGYWWVAVIHGIATPVVLFTMMLSTLYSYGFIEIRYDE